MTDELEIELAAAHRLVARQHEVITCWRRMYVPSELHFLPMPDDMWGIITTSGDYREIVAGGTPTLLNMGRAAERNRKVS